MKRYALVALTAWIMSWFDNPVCIMLCVVFSVSAALVMLVKGANHEKTEAEP